MTITKRIFLSIISAFIIISAVFVSSAPKKANATPSTGFFEWMTGAGANMDVDKPNLVFTLDTLTSMPWGNVTISIHSCTGIAKLEKTTYYYSEAYENSGKLYVLVELSSPLDEVCLAATYGDDIVYSDTRSPIQVWRAAYNAGDTDYFTQAMFDILESQEMGFIDQCETQDFLKLYQYDSTLGETNNATVFKNVVSDNFNETRTYKVEEVGRTWDSLQGSTLTFNWIYNNTDYYLNFTVTAGRNVEITSSNNFEYDYQFMYKSNYYYVKFSLFEDFDKSQIQNFSLTPTNGLAVYASAPIILDEYTSALQSEVNLLRDARLYLLEQVETLTKLSNEQKIELETYKIRITSLESDVTVKTAKVAELEKKKSELEAEVTALRQADEINVANIARLSSELETVKSSLSMEKSELVSKIAELTNELNTCKAKIKAYEKAEQERKEQSTLTGCSANTSSLPYICIVAVLASCIILGGKVYARKKK